MISSGPRYVSIQHSLKVFHTVCDDISLSPCAAWNLVASSTIWSTGLRPLLLPSIYIISIIMAWLNYKSGSQSVNLNRPGDLPYFWYIIQCFVNRSIAFRSMSWSERCNKSANRRADGWPNRRWSCRSSDSDKYTVWAIQLVNDLPLVIKACPIKNVLTGTVSHIADCQQRTGVRMTALGTSVEWDVPFRSP